MSAAASAPQPVFRAPTADDTSARSSDSSHNFRFFASSTDFSGFTSSNFSSGNSGPSRLSRPRIYKVRRKQKLSSRDAEPVNEYHGSHEDEELRGKIKLGCENGDVSGSFNDQLGSNESVTSGEPNGKTEKMSYGGNTEVGIKDSLFSSGFTTLPFVFGSSKIDSLGKEENFLSSLNNGSTNLDKDNTSTFSFGEYKVGSTTKRNFRGKASASGLSRNRLSTELNFNGTGLNQFESGCSVNLTGKESARDADSNSFDVRGKVKDSFFHYQNGKNFVDSSSGLYDNNGEVGSHVEHASSSKVNDACYFSSGYKNEVETGSEFHNGIQNGVFVFGKSNDEQGHNSGDCFGLNKDSDRFNNSSSASAWHSESSDSDRSKIQNTDDEGPLFSTIKELKGLKIDDSDANANKTESFPQNGSFSTCEVFVFRSNKENSSVKKENHTNKMAENTPNATQATEIPLNGVCFQSPSMKEDEKDPVKVTNEGARLDSIDSAEDVKFDFPFNLLFVAGDKKLDSANVNESARAKRLQTINRKSGTRRGKLLGQNGSPMNDCTEQSDNSMCCGSPMDVSPFHDTENADKSANGRGVFDPNRSEPLEHSEGSLGKSSPSLSSKDGLSTLRHQYRKYRLKIGRTDKAVVNNTETEIDKQHVVHDVSHLCDQWRIRGNLAYHTGKLSEAEEYYSMGINEGINAVSYDSIQEYLLKPLLLCYSNRAATRMSLKRMMEAIEDCKKASELDPTFLKATLRAGNCYLVLGEVEAAIQCYSRCLSSGTDVRLDRRATIEAANGLQKAKKVVESSDQAAKLLEEGTKNAALDSLVCIEDALTISCFSESLLQMKGEALCILWRYDELIQLCEQTLEVAKMNVVVADKLGDGKRCPVDFWRWNMQIKAYYHLGRFDLALDLIKKLESMPIKPLKLEDGTQESSVAIAAIIQQLYCLKSSGNESFKSGRYAEAIENYTAAISKSYESRPFMAICFCNRAAAYQSLDQFADAILDCSLAIALDEKYHKAILRRATLHEMIRDYKQSASDLQRLISLLQTESDGSKGDCNRELNAARSRLSFVEKMARKEITLDFYRILGVKASDSESEIKKAYRKAALKHHPDKAWQALVRNDKGDDGEVWKQVSERVHNEAERLFKMIGEAYAVLSDSSKRRSYDEAETMNSNEEKSRKSDSGYSRGRGRQSGYTENRRYHWYGGYNHSTSTRW